MLFRMIRGVLFHQKGKMLLIAITIALGASLATGMLNVVMNTNTIGFKGGCNPIPLNYEVEGGNLVFAMTDLIAGEREFK